MIATMQPRISAAIFFALACCTAALTQTETRPSPQRFALVGAAVIDGTGAPPRAGWTILIEGDRIADVGPDVKVPEGTQVIDLKGKTVLPGLIDMHGHLYANTGKIKNQFAAYPKLYLAGGVTTVFSPGDFDPEGMVDLRRRLREGKEIGTRVFCGGPYFDHEPSAVGWIKGTDTADQARKKLEEWKDKIDGVKVYTRITEEQLKVVLEVAHAAGLRVTGHLGSITVKRALELGIDRLEHGIFAMSDLTPSQEMTPRAMSDRDRILGTADLDSPEMSALIAQIAKQRVVIDPTIVIFQSQLPDVEPVTPDYKRFFGENALKSDRTRKLNPRRMPDDVQHVRNAIKNQMRFVKKVHDAGGIVVAGTDPVDPSLIPGYGLQREIRNFVEVGLKPLAALKAASLDAATALKKEKDLGSIEKGKLADLVVVSGDPSSRIEDIGRTEAVFQAGVRHDPAELRKSVEGLID